MACHRTGCDGIEELSWTPREAPSAKMPRAMAVFTRRPDGGRWPITSFSQQHRQIRTSRPRQSPPRDRSTHALGSVVRSMSTRLPSFASSRAQELLGYLNFSAGAADPQFLAALAELWRAIEEGGL